jgi:hypothetical protein
MSVRWKWVGLWAVVVAAEIVALALGDLLEDAWAIPLIALLLMLTGGRLESRTDRLLVGLFVLATALEFVRHLFLPRDGNFLLASSNQGVADALLAAEGLCVAVGCLAVAGVIGTRWVCASPPRRRAMQDRVEALNGHLLATSPPGEGTVVVAELPCGS